MVMDLPTGSVLDMIKARYEREDKRIAEWVDCTKDSPTFIVRRIVGDTDDSGPDNADDFLGRFLSELARRNEEVHKKVQKGKLVRCWMWTTILIAIDPTCKGWRVVLTSQKAEGAPVLDRPVIDLGTGQ